jgi:hypothetical protein
MNTFKAGSSVSSTFSGVLAPLSLRARVLDEAENVVIPWSVIPVPAGGDVTVSTNATANTLPANASRGIRVVQLEVTTADGVETLDQAYQLEGAALILGVNSFQSYYQAHLAAQNYGQATMAGWVGQGGQADRTAALVEAFGRIRELPVSIEWENDQQIVRAFWCDPPRLRDLTPEQIMRLEPRLLTALKTAQLLEANELLTDDPIRDMRRAGIQSMTTGESSQFFGAARPLDKGICDAASKVLGRWLRRSVRVVR